MSVKICISPMHGGSDRINRGKTGYVEADGVLKIARFTKSYLDMLPPKYINTILTRDKDKTMSIKDHSLLWSDANLILILHTCGNGVKCLYHNHRDLVEKLCDISNNLFGIGGVIESHNEANTIIFEPLSHLLNEELLKNDKNLRLIGYNIAKAITEYFGFKFDIDYRSLDAPKKKSQPVVNIIHVVSTGESLYDISMRYDVKLGDIVNDNKLKQQMLYKGQRLLIKNPKRSYITKHIVKSGETIESICRRYNINVDYVIGYNKLTSTRLLIGQKIIIDKIGGKK